MQVLSRHSKKKPIAEINVVPYLDVLLVLLVIFMITTPLLTQGVEVDLPSGEAAALTQDEQLPIIVTVDRQARTYLNIGVDPKAPLKPRDLHIEVAAALHRSPGRIVLIRGDKHASYDTVLGAMALLQKAGVPSVSLEMQSLDTASKG